MKACVVAHRHRYSVEKDILSNFNNALNFLNSHVWTYSGPPSCRWTTLVNKKKRLETGKACKNTLQSTSAHASAPWIAPICVCVSRNENSSSDAAETWRYWTVLELSEGLVDHLEWITKMDLNALANSLIILSNKTSYITTYLGYHLLMTYFDLKHVPPWILTIEDCQAFNLV